MFIIFCQRTSILRVQLLKSLMFICLINEIAIFVCNQNKKTALFDDLASYLKDKTNDPFRRIY